MDHLHVDFRTHSRTLSDDRGVYFEETNRAIIILQNIITHGEILLIILET